MAHPSYAKLAALARLSHVLAEPPTGRTYAEALAIIIEALQALAGAIVRSEQDLVVVAEQGVDGEPLGGGAAEAITWVAAEALNRRVPYLVANILEASPPLPCAATLDGLGAHSLLVTPMQIERAPLGALVVLGESADTLDMDALAFMETASNALVLAIHRDLGAEAERARREELEEANRMASLGLLTASVAHELRGPVGALVLQLEEQHRLLEQASASTPPSIQRPSLVGELSELTADIETALTRIRGTIEQLSRLSRRDSEPEELDLAEVVRESLAVARPHLRRRGIHLLEDLFPAPVVGRRDNLGQVLLNLVFNAADACEQSSRSERKIMVSVAHGNDYVVLQVDDTGPGIPPNAIKTIFTPFFTTKQRGKGTGLGLKICSDVVTAHGGHIEVVNRVGGGASFRVLLPPALGDAATLELEQHLVPTRPAVHNIMVIDDDPVFSRTVRRGLKEYEVFTAPTASDAEMALAAPDYRPDLVLCDVFLPGLNGHLLHARVKKHDPELAARFVFVTGGALSKEEADYLRASGCPTLFKPLNLDDIRIMLAEGARDTQRPLRTLVGTREPSN